MAFERGTEHAGDEVQSEHQLASGKHRESQGSHIDTHARHPRSKVIKQQQHDV